jgi:hypothetical protein
MNTESYSGHNRPTHKSRLPTDCQTHQRQDDNNTTASTLPLFTQHHRFWALELWFSLLLPTRCWTWGLSTWASMMPSVAVCSQRATSVVLAAGMAPTPLCASRFGMICKLRISLRRGLIQNLWRKRTNLANLRKAISSEKTLADVDATALARDLERHPRPPLDHNGAPFWDGSDAQRLLRLDVDAGKHTSMTKTELRGSRPEYGLFTPKVFRKHIEQEERRCKYIEYLRQVQLRK